MVVARLVKQSLAIPEVRTSNLVIGIIYIEHLFTVNCIQEKKIKKKGPGMAHFEKKAGKFFFQFASRVVEQIVYSSSRILPFCD